MVNSSLHIIGLWKVMIKMYALSIFLSSSLKNSGMSRKQYNSLCSFKNISFGKFVLPKETQQVFTFYWALFEKQERCSDSFSFLTTSSWSLYNPKMTDGFPYYLCKWKESFFSADPCILYKLRLKSQPCNAILLSLFFNLDQLFF